MNARFLFVFSALLLLCANGAFAGGTYQRTKDGKTLVWNISPRPGEAATWSGHRDTDGYATGNGTLTWSTVKGVIVTGSHIPSPRPTVTDRYSGKMVRGKLDGPVVNVNAHGKKFHATFVDGNKASDWAVGPAPRPSRTGIADQRHNEPVRKEAVVEAPAEGPKPTPVPAPQAEQHSSKPAARETSSMDIDDSLRALIGSSPPLRREAVAGASPQASIPQKASSPPARPRLTATEVIELADAEARTQGYDLGTYQRPQAQYATTDNTWSVSYDQSNDAGEAGKPFSVKVEDKTKKTSIVAGR